MPRQQGRQELLSERDAALHVVQATQLRHREEEIDELAKTSSSASAESDDNSILGFFMPTPPSPPSPITPPYFMPDDSSSDSESSDGGDTDGAARLEHLRCAITALHDEVLRARVLHNPSEPPMRAPQIQLLEHFADHRPDLFRKKL
ncbi:hypothetical protein HYDPIDRAFT_32376 [Hydnomerulius pinastri MD-312]|uniref:Uncharacterized protein n=1 Tax=Hydnomerulius pinastri MD-312 TaxID=994086 RepID=A0A0C9V4B5_9AGAM|nr:hypothetical protein HYDPIDRAFT_32376 [Hydnomerulius pinastri MD-312]